LDLLTFRALGGSRPARRALHLESSSSPGSAGADRRSARPDRSPGLGRRGRRRARRMCRMRA
jgi:hypothetical protein